MRRGLRLICFRCNDGGKRWVMMCNIVAVLGGERVCPGIATNLFLLFLQVRLFFVDNVSICL